jgi:hypothetical protein
MAEINDVLGLTEEDINNAESSALSKTFEPLKSGVYIGTVKQVILYKNQWGGEQMRYIVTVKNDKEEIDLTFRSDIGKKLQSGEINKGYAGRLKQFAYATGVSLDSLKKGEKIKFKNFGKDTEGTLITGFEGKELKALVRLTDNTTKLENEAFKFTNDIEGVIAIDGTQSDGTNAENVFMEKVNKNGIFPITPKKSKSKEPDEEVKTSSGEDLSNML